MTATATPPTSLLLASDDARDTLPAGLRVSTTCWTRKAIQLADPKRYEFHERTTGEVVDFDRGIGQRGNDIEALVLGRHFGLSEHAVGRILLNPHERLKAGHLDCGGRVATQVRLPFDGGVSHIDWVIASSPEAWKVGTWEHKSGKWKLPETDHYAVVQLRMWLAEQQGMDLPEWKLLLTDPASYRVSGPFTVALTDDTRSVIADKWDRLHRVLAKLDTIDTRDESQFEGLECDCTQCFTGAEYSADEDLDGLLKQYADAQAIVKASITGDVDEALGTIDTLKDRIRPLIGAGETHAATTCDWRARATNPKPKTKVEWDKAVKAGLLTNVLGDEVYNTLMAAMTAEGYVTDGTPKPSLFIERV